MNDNISINTIKKNTIIKSLKELAEKNDLKISEGDRKVVKKYWYRGSPQKKDALSDIYVKQAGLTTIKNAIDVAQKRAIQKSMC